MSILRLSSSCLVKLDRSNTMPVLFFLFFLVTIALSQAPDISMLKISPMVPKKIVGASLDSIL